MSPSLWFYFVKNGALMNIFGTKENGKLPHGENLDIHAGRLLTKYGSLTRFYTAVYVLH